MQNTNSATIILSPNRPDKVTYSVKVINVSRKSQYYVRKVRECVKFSSVSSLQEHLAKELEEVVLDIGYIEPGHGIKGKQMWLVENADLSEMYTRFKTKHDIMLWCFVQKHDSANIGDGQKGRRKRPSQSDNIPQSKRGTCEQTLNEVEKIVKKLEEKHGTAYSVEKLNVWAHMLHIKKHHSFDEPPNFPSFKSRKSNSNIDHDISEAGVSHAVPPVNMPVPVSPGKRV